MHSEQTPEEIADHFPVIRSVKAKHIYKWLLLGVQDLQQAKLSSLFYGFIFALVGFLMHTVIFEASWLLSALTTGFLLLGPFLAMGLYDLSRQIELNEQPAFIPTLSAWRVNLINVGIFAGVLVVVLLIWARASLIIFALFFEGGLPTFLEVVKTIVTFQQPTFALIYFAVGGLFAAFVFSVSVAAIPLMADKKTNAVTAAIASLSCVVKNPLPMALWALTIALLVLASFATSFLGLIITMPIIGHASWHAYRDLIE